MENDEFSELAAALWERVPAHFKERIKNVALLTEDEPSDEIRKEEGLSEEDTLLGLYQGIPLTERGEQYGVGMTMPDTITLFRIPIIELAEDELYEGGWFTHEELRARVRKITAETLWHEIGHYFGLSEAEIHARETEGTNYFLGE